MRRASPSSSPVSTPGSTGSHHRALWDVLLVLLMVAAFFVFAVTTELAERIQSYTGKLEHWQADEWPLTLVVLALALAWFSYRRWREQAVELQARLVAEAALRDTLTQNRRLAQQLITAQEQERHHLARELHDEMGQSCVAIRVNAQTLMHETQQAKLPQAHEAAASIAQTSDHLQAVVRGMLLRMRPQGLDELGLAASLEALAAQWATQYSMPCDLAIQGDVSGLDVGCKIALYRAAQEALTNIVKHAQATQARLTLQGPEPAVASVAAQTLLRVEDDGRGMQLAAPTRGLGLLGMRERVQALGGSLSLGASPLGGLCVTVSLPIQSTETQSTEATA